MFPNSFLVPIPGFVFPGNGSTPERELKAIQREILLVTDFFGVNSLYFRHDGDGNEEQKEFTDMFRKGIFNTLQWVPSKKLSGYDHLVTSNVSRSRVHSKDGKIIPYAEISFDDLHRISPLEYGCIPHTLTLMGIRMENGPITARTFNLVPLDEN